MYAEGGSSRPTPPHQDGFYWMHELGATMWCGHQPAPALPAHAPHAHPRTLIAHTLTHSLLGSAGYMPLPTVTALPLPTVSQPLPARSRRLALDDADEENGCIRYAAGSAHGPLLKHDFSGVKGFSQQLVEYAPERTEEYAMRACPGDLLVHGAKLIHRAEPNWSATRQRRAVGAIFYTDSARWDEGEYVRRAEEIRRRSAALPGQQGAAPT